LFQVLPRNRRKFRINWYDYFVMPPEIPFLLSAAADDSDYVRPFVTQAIVVVEHRLDNARMAAQAYDAGLEAPEIEVITHG
jgi:hypothetical protein